MSEVYKPTNILVTGGLGFIASNFIDYVLNNYENVSVLNIDKISYCSNYKINEYFNKFNNYKFLKLDIQNVDFIHSLLYDYNIDTILHFAAETHVDNSFGNSLQFTYSNILGTHTLLECCKIYNINYPGSLRKFIHISTDEVYGHIDYTTEGANENFLLNPTNPYAATKASAEFIVKSYQHSFNFPSIIVRCNNIYGKNQFPEKIIPKFINMLIDKQKLTIQGDGNNVRSYLHIDDFCEAFDIILKNGKLHEIYNIGTNIETKNIDIANMLIEKFQKLYPDDEFYRNKNEIITYIEDRPFNDKRYFINYDKLKLLGWNGPNTNLSDGLDKTISFFLE